MLEIKSWHLTWGGPKSKSESKFTLLAWPFTLQNHNIMRFSQAGSTSIHAGTPWCCQPVKNLMISNIIIL